MRCMTEQVVSLMMPWNEEQNGGGCFGAAAVNEGEGSDGGEGGGMGRRLERTREGEEEGLEVE